MGSSMLVESTQFREPSDSERRLLALLATRTRSGPSARHLRTTAQITTLRDQTYTDGLLRQ
jgi:hypothetical protein